MLNPKHRHKLIEGLVVAMGKPRSEAAPSKSDSDYDTGPEPDEGSPREEAADDTEAMACARDAARAIGIDDLDDDKARAFVEAIRKIAG